MGFPRQEDWSGLPFPHPGNLPDPGIESVFPVAPALAGDSPKFHMYPHPSLSHEKWANDFLPWWISCAVQDAVTRNI